MSLGLNSGSQGEGGPGAGVAGDHLDRLQSADRPRNARPPVEGAKFDTNPGEEIRVTQRAMDGRIARYLARSAIDDSDAPVLKADC